MNSHFSGNSKFIKNLNQALILNLVREYELISRNEIAKLTKLTPATISNLTNSLIKDGYLEEKGEGNSPVGRKPIFLKLTEKNHFVIGIDLERVTTIKAAIVNLKANIVCKVEHTLDINDPSGVVNSIVNATYELVDNAKIKIEKIAGIGIGSPGLIDHKRGKIIYSVYPGWKNVPLKALVTQELDIPVIVDTDTNAPALAEYRYGAGKGAQNLAYVTIGPGVGTGIIIGGELYRGIDGAAGEFGHTVIDLNGFPCRCGNYGCLETFITESSLIRQATEEIKKGKKSLISSLAKGGKISPEIIYESALMGDKLAVSLIKQTGFYLGMGLVNLVNLLNPEVIIVGGNISCVADILLESAREVVSSKALSTPARRVKILPSSLGKNAGIIGAATLVLDQGIFHLPEVKLNTEERSKNLSGASHNGRKECASLNI